MSLLVNGKEQFSIELTNCDHTQVSVKAEAGSKIYLFIAELVDHASNT